jgi:DNA polymerase-3 subunit beta
MKVIMSKTELIRSLAKVQGIVERRNTLPILSYVLMNAEGSSVEVSSTDLEVGFKATYKAEVIEPGAMTIIAKKAFESARELPDEEIEIRSEENSWVRLVSGKANFRMVGLPKEDFPDLPTYTAKSGRWIAKKSLLDMVQKTSFAISHDQTRYALNGILLEATTLVDDDGNQICRMVATDGHRLAMVEKGCMKGNVSETRVIIPRKAVMELRKVLEDETAEMIQVDFQENHIFFIGEDTVLAARLIDGQFPEYQQVIPTESKRKASIDREEFGRVLKRVSILTADKANPVRFSFTDGTMTVSTTNPDVGEAIESMAVEYEGTPVDLGFNARYVLDVLGVAEGKRIVLGMNEPLSPGLMSVEGDPSYRYVVMPMRL